MTGRRAAFLPNKKCSCNLKLWTDIIARNNYAAARLQGLEKDLHLVGSQYQTGLSILFVAYVLMQVPSNLLLNYIGRPSIYLGFFVVAWGLVSALTSQVRNYGQIVACRFLLGLVGTLVSPRMEGEMLTWLQRHHSLPAFCSTFPNGTQDANSLSG